MSGSQRRGVTENLARRLVFEAGQRVIDAGPITVALHTSLDDLKRYADNLSATATASGAGYTQLAPITVDGEVLDVRDEIITTTTEVER